MTPVLEAETTETDRPTLASLAEMGRDSLLADLHRVLPGRDPGQVAVAAFNSSI